MAASVNNDPRPVIGTEREAGVNSIVYVTAGAPGSMGFIGAKVPGRIVGQVVQLDKPHVMSMPYGYGDDRVTRHVIVGPNGLQESLRLGSMTYGKMVQAGGKTSRRRRRGTRKNIRRN